MVDTFYTTFRYLIIIYLTVVFLLLFRYNLSTKKAKRITKYEIKTASDTNHSLGDSILAILYNMIDGLSEFFSTSKLFKTITKPYNKYLPVIKKPNKTRFDILGYQLILSTLLVLIAFIVSIFTNQPIYLTEVFLCLIFGFISVLVYFKVMLHKRRKKLESDLLDAIILMNNAFKAGKSIPGAIENVINELDNEMGEEFEKIYEDIRRGLGIDEAFTRFAKSTNLEDAIFIASTITVTSKVGGNIINIFKRIETNIHEKKKLANQTKAMLASANITIKVLCVMPVLLAGVLYFLNPSYFEPLFNSLIGINIILVIMLLYITYLVTINRVMKGGRLWYLNYIQLQF